MEKRNQASGQLILKPNEELLLLNEGGEVPKIPPEEALPEEALPDEAPPSSSKKRSTPDNQNSNNDNLNNDVGNALKKVKKHYRSRMPLLRNKAYPFLNKVLEDIEGRSLHDIYRNHREQRYQSSSDGNVTEVQLKACAVAELERPLRFSFESPTVVFLVSEVSAEPFQEDQGLTARRFDPDTRFPNFEFARIHSKSEDRAAELSRETYVARRSDRKDVLFYLPPDSFDGVFRNFSLVIG